MAWYVAEIVMEITVDGDARNVIHQNLVLIRAESAEEAYESAVGIGKSGESSYCNPEGRAVSISFVGLSQLDLVHEDLEHGAEILFNYRVGVSPEQVRELVHPPEQLRAFISPKRAEGPDYAAGYVIDLAKNEHNIERPRN